MHDAWEAPPLDNDEGMNMPDIDYSELDAYETAYLEAVRDGLTFWQVAFPWLRG